MFIKLVLLTYTGIHNIISFLWCQPRGNAQQASNFYDDVILNFTLKNICILLKQEGNY